MWNMAQAVDMALFTFFKNYRGYEKAPDELTARVDRTDFINFVSQTQIVAMEMYFIGGQLAYKGLNNGLAYSLAQNENQFGPGSNFSPPQTFRTLYRPPTELRRVQIEGQSSSAAFRFEPNVQEKGVTVRKKWHHFKKNLLQEIQSGFDKQFADDDFAKGLFTTQDYCKATRQKHFSRVSAFTLYRELTEDERAVETSTAEAMAAALPSTGQRATALVKALITPRRHYLKDEDTIPPESKAFVVKIELNTIKSQREMYMQWVLYMASKNQLLKRDPDQYFDNLTYKWEHQRDALEKEIEKYTGTMDTRATRAALKKTCELLISRATLSVEEAKLFFECMGYTKAELARGPLSKEGLADGLFELYSLDGTTMPLWINSVRTFEPKVAAKTRILNIIKIISNEAVDPGTAAGGSAAAAAAASQLIPSLPPNHRTWQFLDRNLRASVV
jgi:hypothetical protein